MIDSSVPTCPVPPEQLPINEYQELQSSCFSRWATLDGRGYWQPMVWIWGLSWLVSGPVAAASFAPRKYPVEFFLGSAAGASLVLTLAVLRLYLGWNYVSDRLLNPIVHYEESGWYDGQSWPKPPEILVRDRLISIHEVQPILQKLQRTLLGLGILILSGGLMWICL